jgi:hypothetical protein
MTRQRRAEAIYRAQRAAEVDRQLQQYISERDHMSIGRTHVSCNRCSGACGTTRALSDAGGNVRPHMFTTVEEEQCCLRSR